MTRSARRRSKRAGMCSAHAGWGCCMEDRGGAVDTRKVVLLVCRRAPGPANLKRACHDFEKEIIIGDVENASRARTVLYQCCNEGESRLARNGANFG
jgi:hypothetical protein